MWQTGPKLNGTLGRDWPELGAKAEPKGTTKDPSVRPDKIQIALSIYHSILAQVALRTARQSTSQHSTCARTRTSLSSTGTTHGTSLGSTPALLSVFPCALLFLAPLAASLRDVSIMYQEERKHLALEEKREQVIAPALCLM